MENEDGHEDDGPLFAWLPPEDRLWRHPSEMPASALRTLASTSQGRTPSRVWTVAMAAGLVGALVTSGMFVATGKLAHKTTTVIEPVTTPRSVLVGSTSATQGSPNWPGIAKNLASSVVAVTVTGAEGTVQGSAVLYGDGDDVTYLLSSADLLTGADRVSVLFDDGDTATAGIVGTDPTTGIALLSVRTTRHYNPAVIGSVSSVAVAQPVMAVGAHDASGASVATGSVSSVDQTVSADGSTWSGLLSVSGLSVSASSDGGAVVDQQGDVVGIEASMLSLANQDGLAYAVPIDVAVHVADQLMTGSTPTHAWIGVEDATDLSASAARQLGVAGGAEIGAVDGDSPAARAGLRAHDVVTSFAGRRVTSSGVLTMLLAQSRPGRTDALSYLHLGRTEKVTVTVANQPPDGG